MFESTIAMVSRIQLSSLRQRRNSTGSNELPVKIKPFIAKAVRVEEFRCKASGLELSNNKIN